MSRFDLEKAARANVRPVWVHSLPGHQLQEAVSEAFDAFWQAKKNHGKASFKSCRSPRQCIKFKAGNYKKGTWYPRTTKGLGFDCPEGVPRDCDYGTQLVLDRGRWFGCFPEVREERNTSAEKVIALDPGVRTFLTGFDGDCILEIGQKDIGRVQRLCTHLDNLISRMSSATKRQRYKMRKAAQRIRVRIKDLIKDLHNKTTHLLTSQYKVIFLPTFDVSKMVKRGRRKLGSKTARAMLTFSHYAFSQHLKQAAKRCNCLIVECNESYTSKTCPSCGHIHTKLGGSKHFQCPKCKYSADRDWNGARNIMIRALSATTFRVTSDAILISDFISNDEV